MPHMRGCGMATRKTLSAHVVSLGNIGRTGRLEHRWSAWFDGFAIVPQAGEETVLVGTVADQPALHGLLAKIRDLGLPLLSVTQVENK